MLAPVLGPLDLAVQQPGSPGDEHLLRPRVLIFTPKPPPTSGAMHSTLASGSSSLAATAARTPVDVWVEE